MTESKALFKSSTYFT